MRIRHLTDEALLELIANRLPDTDRHLVGEHLESCTDCSERLHHLRFAHAVFERVAEVGLNAAIGPKPAAARQRDRSWVSWVSAVAVGASCVIGFVLFTRTVPSVRANELLATAVQHENQAIPAIRIQIGQQLCISAIPGRRVISSLSNGCDSALRHLHKTAWGRGNPLSVKTYKDWRSSLKTHRDAVEERDGVWEIQTATDEGEVHEASMEMRVADYHPTRLTLNFEDHEVVSISESLEIPAASDGEKVADMHQSQETDTAAVERVDALEGHAWTTLHRLGFDTGWDAMVLREGDVVHVRALVDGDERRQDITNAFASLPGVRLEVRSSASTRGDEDIVYPRRTNPAGYAPGLAEDWLESQFALPDQRMAFSNQALNLSRHILGRAFFVDRLKRRSPAIGSSCDGLPQLLQLEQKELERLQQDLTTVLDPLLGAAAPSRERALTLAEARRLDAALEDLLLSSDGADEQLKQRRLEEIRRLL